MLSASKTHVQLAAKPQRGRRGSEPDLQLWQSAEGETQTRMSHPHG